MQKLNDDFLQTCREICQRLTELKNPSKSEIKNEVKDSDFAMTALGGGLAAAFTAGKVGALLKLSTLPKVATFGAALASVH